MARDLSGEVGIGKKNYREERIKVAHYERIDNKFLSSWKRSTRQ